MDIQPIYRGSDNDLDLETLIDNTTGAVINDATVTVTVKDAGTGVAVAGETWPKTMAYVSSTNGVYRATLPYTLVLTSNQRLVAEILAIKSGFRAFWKKDLVAKDRRQ